VEFFGRPELEDAREVVGDLHRIDNCRVFVSLQIDEKCTSKILPTFVCTLVLRP